MSVRKDPRAFIRLHNGMPDHPKIEGLSDAAFRALITLWCWCSEHLTDGHVTEASWNRRAGAAGEELIAAGLAHRVEDGYVMHDYLEHQSSRAEVEALVEKRREAGAKGGRAKARRLASATASAKASAVASASGVAKQTASKPVADIDIDLDTASDEAVISSSDASAPDEIDHTVRQLVEEFTDKVRANGHRANPTKRWYIACDRLLRLDGFTPEQVRWVMRWALESSEFWAANIRAFPKFREEFSRLKAQALTHYNASRSGRAAPAVEAAATIELGRRMQAQLEGRAS
jgi:hypothetical protein